MNVFDTYSLEQIIRTTIASVFLIAMLASVAFMVWWGLLMVISGGDEDRVKKAVNHIRYAALGILVLVVIVLVVPSFLKILHLPYGEYFQPGVIFDSIRELASNIFQPSEYSLYDPASSWLPPDFTTLD